MIIFIENIC